MNWRCRYCGCTEAVKAGKTGRGKQRWQCQQCGRRTVEAPYHIDETARAIVDRMLIDGFPPGNIARLTGTSISWVYKRRQELQAL